MKTLTLKSVTLEISNVSLGKQMTHTAPTLGTTPIPSPVEVTMLNVNGSFKLGDVQIAYLNKQYPLTDAELESTTLNGLEDLGLSKVSTEFGL